MSTLTPTYEPKNVFEQAYYSGMNTVEKIKLAYSSPRNCVASYWCLIPMILLILICISFLISLYCCFISFIRTCCCCFFSRPLTRFVRAEPTVVVQPTVIPSYPVFTYKNDPAWRSYDMETRHRKADMYYDSPKYMIQPASSQKNKKMIENNKKDYYPSHTNIPRVYNDIHMDASSDLHLELSSTEDQENSRDFWINFEVESPSDQEAKPVCHRECFSELSVNSNFAPYNNTNRYIANNDVKKIGSDRYMKYAISHPDFLNNSSLHRSPDIYNKNRFYSDF